MNTLRILLVDHDQVDRLAVRRLLDKAGIAVEVEEQGDGREASRVAHERRFDCVLLDSHVPGIEGLQLLRDLRDNGLRVPVVALTGQGDEEVAAELMKAGAADYLNKNTLTPDRLARSLRYALALHRAEQGRRLLLEREQQARLQAQAANRAKDEFLTTLSHELRTPLNAILGWARLLASGHLDQATSRRAVEVIERNTRRQAQLIDDLLDISRIITGKMRLELRTTPVRAILDAAIDALRPAADARQIALVCDCDAGDDPILCDPARMQQVVCNLLSNAIKFTPEGGGVTVTARRWDGSVVVRVADTGVGIDPDFLKHVFDRFRQQNPATTRLFGGLGLGLSIVRRLVELHGGTVAAHSDGEGKGATFTISVPVAPLRNEQALVDPRASWDSLQNLPALDGVKVLVLDSEADARALVAAVLEGCGAHVTTVESVREAIERITDERPDVLLSDIAMPGEDGYDLIRRLRSTEPRGSAPMPAAAMTAFATASDRARALLAGYQAHLPKPVEPSELAAVVAALAGRTTAGS